MVYVNSFRLIQKGSLRMQCIFNATDTVANNRRVFHVKVALFSTQHNHEI